VANKKKGNWKQEQQRDASFKALFLKSAMKNAWLLAAFMS